MKRRLLLLWVTGGALTAVAMALGIVIGAGDIPFRAVAELLWSRLPWLGDAAWSQAWPAEFSTILFQLRLPRVAMGAVVGAGLAVAGALFQTLLRNPLGDPYLLGVSSGAGLGATLAMAFGASTTLWGFSAISGSALGMALLTMAVVYGLARVGGRVPTSTLILSGVIVSSLCSALTLLAATLHENRFTEIMMWLMGRLEVSDPRLLFVAASIIGGSIGAAWLSARELNALRFGEETAGHLGIGVERTKLIILALASGMTAAAVSATGLIGFVGLMVPHAVRGLTGSSDHRLVVPGSAFGGAVLLVLADVAARTLTAPIELPVGVITALIGGPFFLILLRKERKAMSW